MTDEREGKPSASNAAEDLLCQGRHQAQVGLPEVQTSDSGFGNNVHAWCKDKTAVKLTAKEQDMADMLLEIEQKILFEWLGRDRLVEYEQEVRFWNKPNGAKFNSGQLDVYWITDKKRALICDRKSLWGEHEESPSNLQLRDQAVLLWMNRDVDEVICYINQPRVTHSPVLCVYSHDDLMKACDEMEARVRASLAPNPKRVPGEKQCKFCKAKLVCPEAKAMALAVITDSVGLAPELLKKENVEYALANTTTEHLAELLERLPVAKWIFEAAEKEAKARLKRGADVPGWTLAEGKTLNPIVDAQTVYNRALALKVTPEAFMRCINIGKEKLETEVRAVTGSKGKGLESEMRSLIDGCTEPKQCEPSLKRVKRLEVAA